MCVCVCARAVGHETESWSVYRRYLEFYVLESKLTEFHGGSLKNTFSICPRMKAYVYIDGYIYIYIYDIYRYIADHF